MRLPIKKSRFSNLRSRSGVISLIELNERLSIRTLGTFEPKSAGRAFNFTAANSRY